MFTCRKTNKWTDKNLRVGAQLSGRGTCPTRKDHKQSPSGLPSQDLFLSDEQNRSTEGEFLHLLIVKLINYLALELVSLLFLFQWKHILCRTKTQSYNLCTALPFQQLPFICLILFLQYQLLRIQRMTLIWTCSITIYLKNKTTNQKQKQKQCWAVVVHAFNHSTW